MTDFHKCPKCGRKNAGDAVICSGCDFILDTSFLGDDILDAASSAGEVASQTAEMPSPPTDPGSDYGGDALILGKPSSADDEYESFLSEQTGDFLTAPTSAGVRALSPSMVYIDAETKSLLEPEAVIALKEGIDPEQIELSPFEAHVLGLVDGQRPVARIGALSGLSDEDLRICLILIADKGVLRRVGTATPAEAPTENTSFLDDATVADDGDEAPLPPHLAEPTEASDGLPGSLAFERGLDVEDVVDEGGDAPSPFAEEGPPTPEPLPSEFLTPIPSSPAPIPSSVPSLPGQGRRPASPSTPPAASPPAAPPRNKPTIVEPPPPRAAAPEPARPPPARRRPAPAGAVSLSASQKKAEQLYEMALQDIQAGRMARALGYARMAAELAPEEEKYRSLVDNWGKAKQIARQDDDAPEDVRLYKEAKSAEQQGNIDQALAALEKALKVNPRAAALHNQMGVLLATRKKAYAEALSHLFQAVELDANNAAYKNNLGKVLAMSGNSGPVSPLGGGGEKKGRWAKLKGKLF